MEDPTKFKAAQILSANSAEKRAVLLGSVEGKQGEAIVIINPKTPNLSYCNFTQVNKVFQNDIYSRFDVHLEGQYQIQAIFPINQKHKIKYSEKKMVSIKETAKEYEATKGQLLEKELKHIGWVKNIIAGTAEADRVLFRNQQFLIVPDFKFSNLKEIQNLYLLVIFINPDLHSIRDLRGCHIATLKECERQVNKVLGQVFGLNQGSCRMFLHYPPTFYQLHVHVTNLRSQMANSQVERAHSLQNVIESLEVDPNYYAKVGLMKTIEKQGSA